MERPLFSEMLSERRRALGYSIGQASRVLRLREDVLVAFEQGDFEQMPKSGYAQGMISSYARYLGLDPNEVVDVYLEDLEAYRRGELRGGRDRRGEQVKRRSQSPSVGQSYVAKRGLLPTSGGMAGDLGSFATTRVRSREAYSDNGYQDSDWDDEVEQPQEYERNYEEDYSRPYPQGRPYTGRTPSNRRHSGDTGRRSRNRGDVETMRPSSYGYEDDLRFGRDVRSYEAASTGRGRRPRNGSTNRERPSVRRRTRNNGSDAYRDARRSSRGGSRGNRGSSQPVARQNRLLLFAIAAILVLSVIVVLSAVSCIRQGSDDARTVPVSAMTSSNEQSGEQSQQSESNDAKKNSGDSSSQSTTQNKNTDSTGSSSTTNSSQTGTGKNSKTEQETSVSVSVADGAVTWLEIQCDGKSDVAETVTGPWQKTYTVNDVMTIKAGDTKSVVVVQNGRQVQFESITAGIGTLRIQGANTNSKKDDSTTSSSSSNSTNSTSSSNSGSTSAKIGASSETSDTEKNTESTSEGETVTVDGVTYDVYGNVVNTEGGTTGGSSGYTSSGSKSMSPNEY